MASKDNKALTSTDRKRHRLIATVCTLVLCLSTLALCTSCTISYKFNGASIDYMIEVSYYNKHSKFVHYHYQYLQLIHFGLYYLDFE